MVALVLTDESKEELSHVSGLYLCFHVFCLCCFFTSGVLELQSNVKLLKRSVYLISTRLFYISKNKLDGVGIT